MRLDSTVALVTGGTGGLGSHLCHALAAAGCHVVAVYRESHTAARALVEELTAYHGRRALPLAADLADPAAIPPLLDAVEREFGRLKNEWAMLPLRVRGLSALPFTPT